MSGGLQAIGPLGRRIALTAFGAVLALSLGAATASAFRLPPEVTDPAQPQDQTLAQSELPSEAAARTYALENPPVYTVATDHTQDAVPLDATLASTTVPDDGAPIPATAYTVQSDDPQSSDAASTTPAKSAADADGAVQSQN